MADYIPQAYTDKQKIDFIIANARLKLVDNSTPKKGKMPTEDQMNFTQIHNYLRRNVGMAASLPADVQKFYGFHPSGIPQTSWDLQQQLRADKASGWQLDQAAHNKLLQQQFQESIDYFDQKYGFWEKQWLDKNKAASPEIGSLADVDEVGRPFANRTEVVIGKKKKRGFFSKGKMSEDVLPDRDTSLPPGKYVPADAIEDFSPTEVVEQRRKQNTRTATIPKIGKERVYGDPYRPKTFNYGKRAIFLDTETVGTDTTKGSILSIAAVRKIQNLTTGQWDTIDKFTRYYYSTKEDKLLTDDKGVPVYDASISINQLSDENIKARRLQQKASYSKHFNDKELTALMDYIGDDPVIGQNISQFDWPKLWGLDARRPGFQLPQNVLPTGGLIDLYHLSSGTRGFGKGVNDLETMFQVFYNMTTEQAGYTHHDALEDDQITSDIWKAMLASKDRYGRIARYIWQKGLSTQFRNNMIRGWTEVRMSDEAQINELLDRTQGDDADFTIEDIDLTPSFKGGRVPGDSANSMVSAELAGAIAQLSLRIDAMRDMMGGFEATHTGVTRNSVVAQAALFDDKRQRRKFLKTAFKGDALDAAMERATALAERRQMMQTKQFQRNADLKKQREWDAAEAAKIAERENRWQASYGVFTDYVNNAHASWDKQRIERGDQMDPDGIKNFFKAISDATGYVKEFGNALHGIGSAWDAVHNAQQQSAVGIYRSASYFVPSPLKGASDRFFRSGMERWNEMFTGQRKWLGLAEDAGNVVGDVMTGKWGSAIGDIAKTYGNFQAAGIKQRGLGIMSQIDLWSGFTELLLAPLRMAGQGLRLFGGITTRLSGSMLNILKQFNGLGIPLTNLTHMTFADLQRSYTADNMIGASRGTTNNAMNSFANAQMDLYTLGQVSTDRLIAAAMTGTFNSVYGFGGDTRDQYATTVNSLLSQLQRAPEGSRERQRIMMLAGKIDNTLPTRLQQMDNLSKLNPAYKDFNYINSSAWDRARGINRYTTTQMQRARYTEIGMEYGALTDSMNNSLYKIAANFWDKFGKGFMSGANEVLNLIANGQWGKAWDTIVGTLRGAWDNIKRMMAEGGLDFSKIGNALRNGLLFVVKGALPVLADMVADYVELVSKGWARLAEGIMPIVDNLVTRLSLVRFDIEKDENGGWKIGIHAPHKVSEEEAVNNFLYNKDAQKYMSEYANVYSKNPGETMSWGDILQTGRIKVPVDARTGRIVNGLTTAERATGKYRDETFELKDLTPLQWDSLLKQRPFTMRMGDEEITATNYADFVKILATIEAYRQYGGKVENASSAEAGRVDAVINGKDISKYRVLEANGLSGEVVSDIIKELGTQAASAIRNESGNAVNRIELLIKDTEGGETVVTTDSNGNTSVVERTKSHLYDLMNVTRQGISIIGEGISG